MIGLNARSRAWRAAFTGREGVCVIWASGCSSERDLGCILCCCGTGSDDHAGDGCVKMCEWSCDHTVYFKYVRMFMY